MSRASYGGSGSSSDVGREDSAGERPWVEEVDSSMGLDGLIAVPALFPPLFFGVLIVSGSDEHMGSRSG